MSTCPRCGGKTQRSAGIRSKVNSLPPPSRQPSQGEFGPVGAIGTEPVALAPALLKQWVRLEGCRNFQFVSQNLAGFVAVLLTAFIAQNRESTTKSGRIRVKVGLAQRNLVPVHHVCVLMKLLVLADYDPSVRRVFPQTGLLRLAPWVHSERNHHTWSLGTCCGACRADEIRGSSPNRYTRETSALSAA